VLLTLTFENQKGEPLMTEARTKDTGSGVCRMLIRWGLWQSPQTTFILMHFELYKRSLVRIIMEHFVTNKIVNTRKYSFTGITLFKVNRFKTAVRADILY